MDSKYTYIVNISDLDKTWERFEKRTKGDIKRCKEPVFKTNDIYTFDEFHKITRPDRKITTDQIINLYLQLKKQHRCQLYGTMTAMVFISWDDTTAYYLMGARNKLLKNTGHSKLLWEAMKEMHDKGIKEFDLCGANVQSIAKFKRGFGGKLTIQNKQYIKYDVSKESSKSEVAH